MRRRNERKRAYASIRRCGVSEIRLLGLVLIAAGMVLLFLCIPGWAWAAMIGAAMIVAGMCILRG